MAAKRLSIRRVLVGYNGSPSARRALMFADRLAALCRAQLHIVAVAESPPIGSDMDARAIIEEGRLACRRALRAARMSTSRPARLRIVVGQPAQQIVRYAYAYDIDHIVVGNKIRTLFGHPYIGRTARQVIALAPCAVTAVPDLTSARRLSRRFSTQSISAEALTDPSI